MTDPQPHRVRKEMGLTHAEFFRILPRVMGGKTHRVEGLRVVVEDGPRRLEIALSEEGLRRLGPILRLPMTQVTLTFHGYDEGERAAFLRWFDTQFFKGGG